MNLSVLEEKHKIQVISDINDILISKGIPISMPFLTNFTTLNFAYNAFAHAFAIEPTNDGYSKFVDALDQVIEGKKAACNDKISSCLDITSLASQYKMLISKKYNTSNILQVREIFGAILCIDELENSNGSVRRKRSAHCTCPSCNISSVKQFFDCIDPNKLKPIIGFMEIFEHGGYPCLALVVDTTGSMSMEIEAAKNITKTFVTSEKDHLACYLLVPFTDLSDDEYISGSKFYDTFLPYAVQ